MAHCESLCIMVDANGLEMTAGLTWRRRRRVYRAAIKVVEAASCQHNNSKEGRMLASGFSNAPLSRYLVMGVVAASLMATMTDSKHLFWIMVKPHISDYRQFWRCMTWPLLYTNSTEVLFAAMTLYQLRIIERLWGSRKFAVCPASSSPG